MTVSDLTERELIARISSRLPPPPAWMLIGLGDDAAVVEPERNRVEVLTVDALVEGVQFDRAFVPPDAIGHRALAVNLSDIAAMGAAPRLALLSMALPTALALEDFDQIVGGFVTLAARHRLHLAGGNLTRSPGPLMLDVTVTGTVKRRQALTRSGARPGDEIYVSGTIGSAAAGLRMLRAGQTEQWAGGPGGAGQAGVKSRTTSEAPAGSAVALASASGVVQDFSPAHPLPSTSSACIERYLRPEPRVRLGVLFGRNRAATACMDLSDGLADATYQIAQASGVGAILETDALPIEPAARRWFEAHGIDAVEEAATGGDDYELLTMVRPRFRRRFVQAARAADVSVTRIGTCTADGAVILRASQNAAGQDRPLPIRSYRHFR